MFSEKMNHLTVGGTMPHSLGLDRVKKEKGEAHTNILSVCFLAAMM